MTTKPKWYKPDGQLAARMTLTMVLLAVVYVAFVYVLWAFVHLSFILVLIGAGVVAGIQFFMADKIALWSMGARIVTAEEAPQLHDMISRLAQQANLPMPQVAIVDSTVPNAFATGRNERHSVVCVTTGIMSRLNGPEMEAVLAHELTHIINRDVLVMSIASFFAMVAGLLTRVFYWSAIFGGGGFDNRRRDDNGGNLAIIGLLVSAVVSVISFFLVRTLSRYRELAADRGSALITGSPQNLATALMKISDTMAHGRIPDQDLRQASIVSAMCIIPAIRGEDVGELFSTHPSLEHRIAQLQAMQTQMESASRS